MKEKGPHLIELQNVYKAFKVGSYFSKKLVYAVEDISFTLNQGEILALAGESGCGKTTTGKMAVGLLRPTKGKVLYNGKDIWKLKKEESREFRKSSQIIHQDPYSSLNPMLTVYSTLSAPLFKHKIVNSEEEATDKVSKLLETVGLTPPEEFLNKYPHQLSGGQRQRVVIARALTLNPKFIVADEPVSMIDVSLRISILHLMLKLRDKFNLAYLFISHDLATGKYFAKGGRVAIMYLGNIVEIGPTLEVIKNPLHPYTKALLSAIPEPDPQIMKKKKVMKLRSLDIPSLLNVPSGCKFHTRCPLYIKGKCDKERPKLVEVEKNHYVACHIYSG